MIFINFGILIVKLNSNNIKIMTIIDAQLLYLIPSMKYNQGLPNITYRVQNSDDEGPTNRKRNLSLNLNIKTENTDNLSNYSMPKHQSQYSPKKYQGFSPTEKIDKHVSFMQKCRNDLQVYLSRQKQLIRKKQSLKKILNKSCRKNQQGYMPKLKILLLKIPQFQANAHIKAKNLLLEKKRRIKTQHHQKPIKQNHPIRKQHQNEQNLKILSPKKYRQLSFKEIIDSQSKFSHEFTNKLFQENIKQMNTKLKDSIGNKQVHEIINGW